MTFENTRSSYEKNIYKKRENGDYYGDRENRYYYNNSYDHDSPREYHDDYTHSYEHLDGYKSRYSTQNNNGGQYFDKHNDYAHPYKTNSNRYYKDYYSSERGYYSPNQMSDLGYINQSKQNIDSVRNYRYNYASDYRYDSHGSTFVNEDIDEYSGFINNSTRSYEDYQSFPETDNRYKIYDGRYKKDDDFGKRMKLDYKNKPKHVSGPPNTTLGIFGLNPMVTDEDLKEMLESKLPGIHGYTFKLIVDDKTELCKGFCFVNFRCLNDSISARGILNNESFRGQDFKCDYSYKN